MRDPHNDAVRNAICLLQAQSKVRFGDKALSSCGENTVSIGPNSICVTNKDGIIIARGVRTATKALIQKPRRITQ
jgi:hypothetical protein